MLCYTQVLYPSLKGAKERACQFPAGLQLAHPHPKAEGTPAYPKKKQLQTPSHLGRDYEMWRFGVRAESITQKGKQKEMAKTGSHRSPNVIGKEAQVYVFRLLREIH